MAAPVGDESKLAGAIPCSVGKSDPQLYGQTAGILFRVWTTHSLPLRDRALRYAVITILAGVWMSTLNLPDKCFGIVTATIYSAIEFCFCKVVHGQFYTTSAQWLLNVIYLPYMFKWVKPLVDHNVFLFSFTFPFQVWLLEVIQGYFLIWVFGHNVAWSYDGKFAFFHGNIKVSMYHLWAAFGFGVIIGWPLWTGLSVLLLNLVQFIVPALFLKYL